MDAEKCKGCTNCIKRCPTEAIRVRDGKARITDDRCIDCGECIRVCPYHAKLAMTDEFNKTYRYKYTIALPAPTLYGQFKNLYDVNMILTGLKRLGFNEVFEVALAAELITAATKELLRRGRLKKPAISSACPAVVRLVCQKFPSLIGNLVPLVAPMELAAILAKEDAIIKTVFKPEDIGVFFITPCAAKYTAIHSPIGVRSSLVDGVISIKDIYTRLLLIFKKIDKPENLSIASHEGIMWAENGGESGALPINSIAVDGIHNVVAMLEDIEDDKLETIDFLEASACHCGCVGGPLTIENAFVARSRIDAIKKNVHTREDKPLFNMETYCASALNSPIDVMPMKPLDDDMIVAMQKLSRIDELAKSLPNLDCGSCGAPSCRALAEDIVQDEAALYDCIFKLRDRIRDLAREVIELGGKPNGESKRD